MQLFSTSLKGIIRKECQSFTNHGHAKTPPAVFNPLSLWLTLPRDMGVSHTLWPPSITRAILAYLWFAQGLHKAQKNQSSRVILACPWFAQGLHSREITEACCRPGHGPHRSHAETDLLGIMIIQPGHQVVLCAGNRKDAGHPGRKKKMRGLFLSSMLLSIRTCREYHLPAGLWRGNARDSYYLSMVILPASSSIQFSTAGSQ